MKKRLLFFTLISILFIGCSSDSGSSLPVNEENLLGRWYFKGFTIDNGPMDYYEQNCSTSKDYMEILTSHDVKYYKHTNECVINNVSNASWTLNENFFTTINQDPIVVAPGIYKVLSITEEQLVLRRDFHPISPSETEVYKYYYTRD